MFRSLRTFALITLLVVLVSVISASASALDVSGGTIDAYSLDNPVPPPTAREVGTSFEVSSDLFRSGGAPASAIALPVPADFVITEPDPADFTLCVGGGCAGGIPAHRVTLEDTNGDGIREVVAWFNPSDFYVLVETDLSALDARIRRVEPAQSDAFILEPYYGSEEPVAESVAITVEPGAPAALPETITFTFTVNGTVNGWPKLLVLDPPLKLERR